MQEERTYIKTLPSLSKMFEDKVAKLTGGKNGQEARKKVEEQESILKKEMDINLDAACDFLHAYRDHNDMYSFYTTFS